MVRCLEFVLHVFSSFHRIVTLDRRHARLDLSPLKDCPYLFILVIHIKATELSRGLSKEVSWHIVVDLMFAHLVKEIVFAALYNLFDVRLIW